MTEIFDYKRFLLLYRKRFWKVILFTALCALITGVIYYVYLNFFTGSDIYRCASYYYIDFTDENVVETHDFYNDYTWNDVLDSDVIALRVSEITGIDKEYIAKSTTIPTMSDIRFLWVFVDDCDSAIAEKIQNAIYVALSEFAVNTEGFNSITIYDGPYTNIVEKDDLIVRVVIFSAVISFIFGFLILLYRNATDTKIYSFSDVENATGVMPIGMITEDKVLYPETKAHIKELFSYLESDEGSKNLSKKAVKKIAVVYEEAFVDIYDKDFDISFLNNLEIQNISFKYVKHTDEKFYDNLKEYDDYIMLVKYKNCDRTLLKYAYDNAVLMHLKPVALLIDGMDRGFAYWYYR